MKKSQILAALALAFALGVVAPIAGVVSNASAYSEEKGTATFSDTTSAINFVENDATYKAYVKLQNAIRTYDVERTANTIADFDGSTEFGKIDAKLGNADGPFAINTTNIASDVAKAKTYAEKLAVYTKALSKSALYTAYAKYIAILEDNDATDGQLISALTTLRTTLGWSDNDGNIKVGLGLLTEEEYEDLHPEEATLAAYRASNPFANWNRYKVSKEIYDAVNGVEEALAKYTKGVKIFLPWMVESGLMKDAAKEAVEDTINPQPNYLYATAKNANNFKRIAQLGNLYSKVQAAKSARVAAESGDNYTIIAGLADAWKAATGNEEALKTVMARMAAYKAPANTNDDETTIKDPNLKPGNTGALNSTAEGTASTTVSIVAGLATALTALGAGVVAYRNARRSSEN